MHHPESYTYSSPVQQRDHSEERSLYISHLEQLCADLNAQVEELSAAGRRVRGLEREVEMLRGEIESWEQKAEEWDVERERFRRRIKVLDEERKRERDGMLREIKEMSGGVPLTPLPTPTPLPCAWGEVEELRRRWTVQQTPSREGLHGYRSRGPHSASPESLHKENFSPTHSPPNGLMGPPQSPLRARYSHSHSASVGSSYSHHAPSTSSHARTPSSTTSIHNFPSPGTGRHRSNSSISGRSALVPTSPLTSPLRSKPMRRFGPGEQPQPLLLPAASALHSPRRSVSSSDFNHLPHLDLDPEAGMALAMNPLGDSLFKELARAENARLEAEEAEDDDASSSDADFDGDEWWVSSLFRATHALALIKRVLKREERDKAGASSAMTKAGVGVLEMVRREGLEAFRQESARRKDQPGNPARPASKQKLQTVKEEDVENWVLWLRFVIVVVLSVAMAFREGPAVVLEEDEAFGKKGRPKLRVRTRKVEDMSDSSDSGRERRAVRG